MTKFQDFFSKRYVKYIAAAVAVAVSAVVIYLILSNFQTEPTTFVVTKTESMVAAESAQQSDTVYFSKSGKKYHIKSKCGGGDFFPCTLEDALDMGLEECKICSKINQE
jgi:hypothetical protein